MFEVGKKYIYKKHQSTPWLCQYVGTTLNVGIRDGAKEQTYIHTKEEENWEEYVPPTPLTFADLKVGEKFKWVKRRDCGEGALCIKLQTIGGDYNKIPFGCGAFSFGWTALEGDRIGTIWGQNNEEVIRCG